MLKISQEDREILRKLIGDYDRNVSANFSFGEGKRRLQEGILEMFAPQYYYGIKTPLFERKEGRFHRSNGLLLTGNGYFVTCYHCVEETENILVLNSRGETHPIEGVFVQSKSLDVAIVKAKINGPKEHINYKYAKSFTIGQYSTLLTRKDSLLEIKAANIRHGLIRDNENTHTLLNCDKTTVPGDSGGILTSTNGEIISLHSGIGVILNPHTKKEESEVSISTPFHYVIKLLRQACG